VLRRFLLATAASLAILVPSARAQSPQSPVYQSPAPPPRPAVQYYAVAPRPPRTIHWGPGRLGKSIAWFGRELQWFDRQHTWVIGHSVAWPVKPTPVPPTPVVPQPEPIQMPTPSAQAGPANEEAPPAPKF
jgi:hypothetical protein